MRKILKTDYLTLLINRQDMDAEFAFFDCEQGRIGFSNQSTWKALVDCVGIKEANAIYDLFTEQDNFQWNDNIKLFTKYIFGLGGEIQGIYLRL